MTTITLSKSDAAGVKTDAEYLMTRISQPLAVASAEGEAAAAVL